MKLRLLLIATLLFFVRPDSFAQHEHEATGHAEAGTHHEMAEKNAVSLFYGNTIITQSKFNLPTVGIEYFREINHRLAIGLISEVEIGSHVIQKDELGVTVAEVEREGAVLVLPTIAIRLVKGLLFYGGYGIEFEKKENLGLLKLGTAYDFELMNPHWVVAPNISWDHTELFDGVVYGVNIGYKF